MPTPLRLKITEPNIARQDKQTEQENGIAQHLPQKNREYSAKVPCLSTVPKYSTKVPCATKHDPILRQHQWVLPFLYRV